MYEDNLRRIEKRINAGLELLDRNYEVTEIPVKDIFKSFTVAGRRHVVRQFEIDGVGNLLIMTNPDDGMMQMDTFTITPYYKNLPLFTTDYMYFEDHMSFLNEIYDLVETKDDRYSSYIGRFKRNCAAVSSLEDMKIPPCWYDDIRPVVVAKNASYDDEDLVFDLFLKNLQTFIDMEKSYPELSGEHMRIKWEKNYEYARALVEDGGVSTKLFVESLGADETKEFFYSVFFAPDRFRNLESVKPLSRLISFFDQEDASGMTNLQKVKENQKVIRRLDTTSKDRSYDEVGAAAETEIPSGIVVKDGIIKGFGIEIFNQDVYPLQSFEIYLRSCGLTGKLDLTGCEDMVFVDVYHNGIEEIKTGYLPSMRIFGIQDNEIRKIDVTGMPSCQGIDAGMNSLREINVSMNPELVELYVNDNELDEIDLSFNNRLKYFYCQYNHISELDTRMNPKLRHLNATANPMRDIWSYAPQREELLPLEVHAGEGGCIGMRFNPVYNAQWKETGEWEQVYYAYPDDGYDFAAWYEDGRMASSEDVWYDEYGTSRVLEARFVKIRG